MSNYTTFEQSIADVMAQLAEAGETDEAVKRVLDMTRELRPEPHWLALLKEPPMRTTSHVASGSPPVRLALILAVTVALLAAAGAALVGASLMRSTAPSIPNHYGPARNGDLLFERDGDIYRADPSGGNQVVVVAGAGEGANPVFSHDGSMFAFERGTGLGNRRQLVIANADGTDLRAVTVEFAELLSVDFSPDGSRIVFVGRLNGQEPTLYTVPTDGGRPTPLFVADVVATTGDDAWVAWRPTNGGEILFRGEQSPYSRTERGIGLFAVTPGEPRPRLIAPLQPVDTEGPAYAQPRVSPDGSSIVYSFWGPDAEGRVDAWAHLLDVNTGADRIIHSFGTPAAFSPDGSRVAGVGFSEIVLERVDATGAPRVLGRRFESDQLVSMDFSPDGSSMIATFRSGTTWLIDVATGEIAEPVQPVPNPASWQRLAP